MFSYMKIIVLLLFNSYLLKDKAYPSQMMCLWLLQTIRVFVFYSLIQQFFLVFSSFSIERKEKTNNYASCFFLLLNV